MNLSQAQLATELGVAANTVARWERGELPIANPTMVKLALSALKYVGFRTWMNQVVRECQRVLKQAGKSSQHARSAAVARRLEIWCQSTLALSDEELKFHMERKVPFPGYHRVTALQHSDLAPQDLRRDLGFLHSALHRALEQANRLWTIPYGKILNPKNP
jgi:transcriptional regulator with XRE-family HTH domain